jgi:outer membrane protein assembly factor BamB
MAHTNRRRFLRAAAASAVGLGAGCSAPVSTGDGQLSVRTEPGWSEFRGDRYNTGYASGESDIEEPAVRWSFEADGAFWGSPVVADGTVYSGCADGALYAVDADTGEQEWAFRADDRIEGTPQCADGTVFVGSYDRHVYALDGATGEPWWDLETEGLVRGSPKVADGTVYVGVGCHNLACGWYAEEPSETGWLYALDAATGTVEWRRQLGTEVVSTPAVGERTLFVGSSDGYLYALDRASGEQRWRYRTREWVWSAPTLAFGTVFFTDWDAEVHAVDAETGEREWLYDSLGAYISGSTAVDERAVYFGFTPANASPDPTRSDAEVFALDRRTGEELWTYTTDALEIGSSPAITDDAVYIGSHSQSDEAGTGVYALGTDGSPRWFFEVRQRGVGTSPALVDGVLYFGGADERLYALE